MGDLIAGHPSLQCLPLDQRRIPSSCVFFLRDDSHKRSSGESCMFFCPLLHLLRAVNRLSAAVSLGSSAVSLLTRSFAPTALHFLTHLPNCHPCVYSRCLPVTPCAGQGRPCQEEDAVWMYSHSNDDLATDCGSASPSAGKDLMQPYSIS